MIAAAIFIPPPAGFLSPLNVDGFYAHKKPWQRGFLFLTPGRLTHVNSLIQEINARLNHPPTAAHQALYTQFSSAYFWQTMANHSDVSKTQEIWENTHLVIYAENQDLVWLMDYAFPMLEEYLHCAQKEGEALKEQAQASIILAYLPGKVDYLQGIDQHATQLIALNACVQGLKKQWALAIQLKIEQQNDLLKYIATCLHLPCDFSSADSLDSNALMFLRQAPLPSPLTLPQRMLDKNPPLISLIEAQKSWERLSHRLRGLKKKHRLTAPKLAPKISPFKDDWPTVYKLPLYFIQEGIRYASIPVFIGLFLNGWLTLSAFAIGLSASLSYPWLIQLPALIWRQWQRIEAILSSGTQAYFHDYLIERTEYIETIERSALWRKNRLACGCHELSTFDPHLLLSAYEDFQKSLQSQIDELTAVRPPVWQIWRLPTLTLVNALIAELTLEKTHLHRDLQYYAEDIAHRVEKTILSSLTFSLEKITLFVTRFAQNHAHKLNVESRAVNFFLACLIESATSPILLKRALIAPTDFATHCPDVMAIDSLMAQVTPFIKEAKKGQALDNLASLLKHGQIISPEQVENDSDILSSSVYPKEKIKKAIQEYAYATFSAKTPSLKKFFTPQHNNAFDHWLLNKKHDLKAALSCVTSFLALPANQDWGLLPNDFPFASPEVFSAYLRLIELSGHCTIGQEVQEKIILLAPNYTGAPSAINGWLNSVWPQHCPATVDELILQARLNWTLENITSQNNLEALDLFIRDATLVLPRVDNDHLLARALVNHTHFYLPWQAHTQKALSLLEEKGLLLPNAKAVYSQKALHEWLLKP